MAPRPKAPVYQVEHDECEQPTGPVVLWSNDELVRAVAAIQDEMKCRMNGCQNPGGTGDWSADCDGGRVVWDVGLSGVRAVSKFTYTECQGTAIVDVHDYAADPDWLDENCHSRARDHNYLRRQLYPRHGFLW